MLATLPHNFPTTLDNNYGEAGVPFNKNTVGRLVTGMYSSIIFILDITILIRVNNYSRSSHSGPTFVFHV